MNKRDTRFYLETAKFCFSVISGGAAGYFAARGLNSACSKAAEIVKAKVAERMLNASPDVEPALDVLGEDDDDLALT